MIGLESGQPSLTSNRTRETHDQKNSLSVSSPHNRLIVSVEFSNRTLYRRFFTSKRNSHTHPVCNYTLNSIISFKTNQFLSVPFGRLIHTLFTYGVLLFIYITVSFINFIHNKFGFAHRES